MRRYDIGDPTLRDVTIEDAQGYAVGENGRVFEYSAHGWREKTTETGQYLRGRTGHAGGCRR